jgi:hypothetical protein
MSAWDKKKNRELEQDLTDYKLEADLKSELEP